MLGGKVALGVAHTLSCQLPRPAATDTADRFNELGVSECVQPTNNGQAEVSPPSTIGPVVAGSWATREFNIRSSGQRLHSASRRNLSRDGIFARQSSSWRSQYPKGRIS